MHVSSLAKGQSNGGRFSATAKSGDLLWYSIKREAGKKSHFIHLLLKRGLLQLGPGNNERSCWEAEPDNIQHGDESMKSIWLSSLKSPKCQSHKRAVQNAFIPALSEPSNSWWHFHLFLSLCKYVPCYLIHGPSKAILAAINTQASIFPDVPSFSALSNSTAVCSGTDNPQRNV